MKVLRELFIQGPPDKLLGFPGLAASILGAEWERDTDAEQKLAKGTGGGKPMFCFATKTKSLPEARLWLAFKEDDKLYVSNIVPVKVNQLSQAEYNSILVKFGNDLAEIMVHEPSFQINLDPDQKDLKDFFSEETAKKLTLFSVAANKSTGSAHPMDRERWLDFIISSVEEGSKISPSELETLLIEDEEWPPEEADELSSQYSFALEVLKAYREKTGK
jgi:hypothetical protein